MKQQMKGLAFLLLGIIFAVTRDSIFWITGVVLGIIGLVIVIINSKPEKTNSDK